MPEADELEKLAREIWLSWEDDDHDMALKLLRSIEIAALREAREVVEKNESHEYSSLEDLDKKIMELELR